MRERVATKLQQKNPKKANDYGFCLQLADILFDWLHVSQKLRDTLRNDDVILYVLMFV